MSNDVQLTKVQLKEPGYPPSSDPGHSNPGYSESNVADVGIEVGQYPDKPAYQPANGLSSFNQNDEDEGNFFNSTIAIIQNGISEFYAKNEKMLWLLFKIALLLGYIVYFIIAMVKEELDNNASVQLLWMTCVFFFLLAIYLVFTFWGDTIYKSIAPCTDQMSKNSTRISWIVVAVLYVFIAVFIIVDVTVISKKPRNLISLIGMASYIIILFIFSYNPSKVQWRAVVWGIGLQFVLALFILRWKGGYDAFKWIGDRIAVFLSYTEAGSEFVFGGGYQEHFIAFVVLPTIIFFSTIISILFHLGTMQVIIKGVAKVMQAAMGTTAGESLNAAGNIFVGQTEAPLMIKPLLKDMTHSELHAVMTGGFATIAGGVLAAYIAFQVPANHLISASVMSAPAALAMAKLFYPETEQSKTKSSDVKHLPKGPEQNIIEAASAGASASIGLVANVAANLIAFLAILAFINATLTWFGNRVHIDELTFELICSYVLQPFVWVMGVPWDECQQVARLVGVKTFLNEFIAYEKLSVILKNTAVINAHIAANGSWSMDGRAAVLYNSTGTYTFKEGIMSPRTVAITTYALCGFANIGSIGIQLGGLGAMAPEKKPALARVAVRAMIAGNVACFLTASVAGLFYQDYDDVTFSFQ